MRAIATAALVTLPALSARGADVTSTWLTAANGTWSNAVQWSAGVPNNGAQTFAAVVGAAGAPYTVALNSAVTVNDLTISTSAASVDVINSLAVLASPIQLNAGTLRLNGGVINGGSINLGGGTIAFANNNQNRLAAGAVLNGDVNLNQPEGRVRLQTGASFTGNGNLTSSNNILSYEYDATIDNQTINLDGSNGFVSIEGLSTLTVGANGVIRGRGTVGNQFFVAGTTSLANGGRIAADLPGQILTVRPDNLVNNGTLAASAGTLSIASGSFTTGAAGRLRTSGTGVIDLGGTIAGANLTNNVSRSGGTIVISGTLNNVGNTLALTATTGDFQTNGGIINGGTVTQSGGILAFAGNNLNRLGANALLTGGLNLNQVDSRVRLQTGANFTGNANLTSANNILAYEHNAALDNQSVNLDGNNGFVSIEGSSTLTLGPNGLIRGRGTVGNQFFVAGTTTILNGGRVAADLAGQVLNVRPDNLVNNGTLEASAGTLSIASGSFTTGAAGRLHTSGTGVIDLSGTLSGANLTSNVSRSGGTIVISGTLNNAGNTLALTATTGDFQMNGGILNGGTVTQSGGILAFSGNNANRLGANALLTGGLNLNKVDSRVRLQTGARFTGNANLTSVNNILAYEHNATIDNQTINLDGSNGFVSIEGANTLTVSANGVIRGRGTVGNQFFVSGATTLANGGRVAADLAGQILNVRPINLVNSGTLEASAGTLVINAGSYTTAPTGRLKTSGTGVIDLDGTISGVNLTSNVSRSGGTINVLGTVNNAGNTLVFTPATGNWNLLGGIINGGTITQGGGNLVFTGHSQNRLGAGALVTGDLNLNQPAGRVRLQTGAGFTGNANLTSSDNILAYEQTGTLNNATVNLDGTNAFLSIEGPNTLTLGTGGVVRGRGTVGTQLYLSGANGLVNNGRVSADATGQSLVVQPLSVTNNGTFEAVNAATLTTGMAALSNAGRLRATGGGKLLVGNMTGNLGDAAASGAGSLVRLNGTYTINQPTAVTDGATLNLLGSWTKSATIDASARVIFDYASAAPSPLAALRSDIISGYASGAWTGPGIRSSAAAATAGTGVGYAEAFDVLGPTGGIFSGENVDGTAVLVRWTRYGDANLDGQVNLGDFNRLAANFGQANRLWSHGDFDYNGTVNLGDFNRLAANFGLSAAGPEVTPQDWSRLGAAIPEPTAFAAAASLLALRARRTRRRPANRR